MKIGNVSSLKFLGIMLIKHLTWMAHINMITIKLSKVVGILNKCLFKISFDEFVYITVLITYKL